MFVEIVKVLSLHRNGVCILQKFLVSVLAVLLVLGFAGPAIAADFPDLDGHWSKRAVMLINSRGVINGYPDGSFRPDAPVTRAEFARMLVTAVDLGYHRSAVEKVYSAFTDVDYDHWAKNDVIIARESGLVEGYGKNIFGPEDFVRRQEMAALLVRALKYLGAPLPETAPLQFADRGNIAGWARDYVSLAAGSGLIKGYPDGTFRPLAGTTRAEAATILYRFLLYTGGAFDYAGELKDTDGKLLYIDNNGRTVAFSVYGGARFFQGERQVDYQQLSTFKGKQLSVNFNVYGDVIFGQLGGNFTLPRVKVGTRQSWGRTIARHIRERQETGRAAAGESFPAEAPVNSLKVTKQLMGVTEFTYENAVDGSGQVIAVVDTGVDVSHSDLQYLPNGEYKIVDWVDFTGEGQVGLSGVSPAGEVLPAGGEKFITQGIPTAGGQYRFGFFSEQDLGFDINFSGDVGDRYLVLATDAKHAGVYDTVYVDTDGDGDLAEESGLAVYRRNHRFSHFASRREGYSFPFVVSELDSSGEMVKLGFDASGHGTHIAGIAAANGKIQGVAPGAKLLVIKAINSSGQVDWEKLQEAVTYAAVSGADIINLSLGYYQDITGGDSRLARTINQLVEKYDVIFTVASGNKGPGIGSMAAPGNASEVVSVGAYISPSMWEADFQWRVKQGGLWYFSSMGPRKDGLLMPTVVAPGSAFSTAPGWAGLDYFLLEGTSMAAPHVAGVAALLMDAAADNGVKVTAAKVREALARGAGKIPQLDLVEAGNGLVNIQGAWDYLRRAGDPAPLGAVTFNDLFGMGRGLYARDFVPGNLSYQVFNLGGETRRLTWRSTVPWMKPLLGETAISGKRYRELPVRYDIPESEGLYTGLLIGDDRGTFGSDLRLLNTVVRPYRASEDKPLALSGKLGAGQVERYFVDVPFGTKKIKAELEVPRTEGGFRGRARIHLVQPNGEEVVRTDYAGNAPAGYEGQQTITAEAEAPLPGVWEIVVYSSATLSLYNQEYSSYRLTVGITGGEPPETKQSPPEVIVGAVPGVRAGDGTGFVGLTLLDFRTKKPVSGVMEVNGRLYNVRDGRLRIITKQQQITVNL